MSYKPRIYKTEDIFTAGDLIEILKTVPPDTQIVLAHSEVRTRPDADGEPQEYDYCETGYISHVEAGSPILWLYTDGLDSNC